MSAFEKFQRFIVTILIAIACFYGGWYFGKRGFIFEVRKNPPQIEVTNQYPADQKVDFALFWEVWGILQKQYLLRPVDPQKMIYGAIQGMVASLGDPYTAFLPPDVNKSVDEQLNGKYHGIGAELGIKDSQLIVIAPLDGSPAKAAGLKSGDKILKINNQSTYGLSVTDAVGKIRGDAGTKVTLTTQTDDQEPKDITITRGIITVASVVWEDKGDGTAYIRVSRFGGETNSEWDKAISEVTLRMKELDAVIIDVRGNPGGYLQSAVHLAGEFFGGKPVLYEESSTGKQVPFEPDRVGSFKNVPAVFVLIDEGSASASEILAAALKSQINATLIGQKSFGKGTIQDSMDFSQGAGLHVTIAKWLTPEKVWVNDTKGIEPDISVEITDEDAKNNVDTQLNKALELAKEI